MKICVAGWYYRPNFIREVFRSGFEAMVIKHREGDMLGLPSALYDNKGLEFGCYQQYLDNHWDGESDVLFIHDDVEVKDTSAFADAASLTAMGLDQVYIFGSIFDEQVNQGVHGRAMWCRGSWLAKFKENGGFPVDWDNSGDIFSSRANNGILAFCHLLESERSDRVNVTAIIPKFTFGRRGWIADEMVVFRRTDRHLPVSV